MDIVEVAALTVESHWESVRLTVTQEVVWRDEEGEFGGQTSHSRLYQAQRSVIEVSPRRDILRSTHT